MKALIFAMDEGKVLNKGGSKALVRIFGVTLIERCLRLLSSVGIRDIVVVIGPDDDSIEGDLGSGQGLALNLRYIRWGEEEGWDSCKVKEYIDEEFLVLSSNIILDKRILEELLKQENMIYCYDSQPRRVDGLTIKVSLENHRVKGIGRDLETWDGVGVGVYRFDPRVLPIICKYRPSTWTACLNEIVERFEVLGLDVMEMPFYVAGLKRELKPFWFKIDTKQDLDLCKKLLLKEIQKGVHLTAYLNKPLENWILYRISELPWITPNRVTIFSNLFAYLVAILFLSGSLLYAAIFTFVVSIVDGLDGKLARARAAATKLGSLEHSFDQLFEQVIYASFALGLYFRSSDILPLILGISMLISDSFVRHVYMQFGKVTGIPLTDYSPFDRLFAKIDGRRNIYFLYILAGVIIGAPIYSLILMLIHSALTATVYSIRAAKHLHEADKSL